ncbi:MULTISPECIES: RusA family crossover junction endodeoxyribonuclease [unclassified Bradyrhizobium]|uniref:RusA family crossover junction endodeoxyribonuclease n=1 Tax=unclassified Bradyrhizobium TaxID=2631580 RepID=UPI00247A359F|nr:MULTISPECIES: RusA family crossover junction endodeoxyribonuclease [unclassified Bradyrhizobium]WGR67831.1 RusA family crossover junction endodeoxyribonuclease [Bradyrhizobium sp. ISRA426]WGR79884.1 RusA family crossover junction endodeoxyribonuclease [Bradyrhizobium sp. ISRA430]WGR83070.1 RusA family crossover junction endodeoxyribonuclease [Bradyrhizobium sp. ISRA432]
MSEPITITLPGAPQGKGRARAFLRGGKIGHYTPQKTRSYESLIFGAAVDVMRDRPPFDEAVQFTLRAIYPVPASWSERKRQKALAGEIRPAKKPDLDNVAKAWNDALNGVVYRDDAQIVLMWIEKRYGPQPLVVCTIQPVEAAKMSEVRTASAEGSR